MIALRRLARIGLGVTFAVASGFGLSGCGGEDLPTHYSDAASMAFSNCGDIDVDPATADEKRLTDTGTTDAFTLQAADGTYVAVYWDTEDWAGSRVYCPGDRSGMYRWDGEKGKWSK